MYATMIQKNECDRQKNKRNFALQNERQNLDI